MSPRASEDPKTVAYRISGLPSGTTADNIYSFLKQQKWWKADSTSHASVLPKCDDAQSSSCVAIVKLSKLDSFVDLDDNPHLEYPDDEGRHYKVTFDRHFHGFTQLSPSIGDNDVVADVIAITGMDGHAYASWISRENRNSMWLQDFLPQELPQCRILIYGYHSKLSTLHMNTLLEYADEFFAELCRIRSSVELQRRPLLFIAHSYGGLVLTHCLVRARLSRLPEERAMFNSTCGMLFFGTPHRGSEKNALLQMVPDPSNPRRSMLSETLPDSSSLKMQLNHFQKIVRQSQIVTFYETELTPTPIMDENGKWSRKGPPALQVSKSSAVLQLPDVYETVIPVNSDHSNLVKFASPNDKTYKIVVSHLQKFAAGSRELVRERYALEEVPAESREMLPFQRDPNFVRRNEFLLRLQELFSPDGYHLRVALIGLGGIGKSQIANEFAWMQRSLFPTQSVYWVRASSQQSFRQSYREIANVARLPGRNDKNANILQLVYDFLADNKNGPWLVVLDNADDEALLAIDPNLQEAGDSQGRSLSSFLPRTPRGKILITSRRRDIAEKYTGAGNSIVKVTEMSKQEASELLRVRSGDTNSSDDDAIALVEELECIPLVVSQVAAYISQNLPGIDISKTHSLCKNSINYKKFVMNNNLTDFRRQSDTSNAIFSTLQLSFEAIHKDNRASKDLLALMSTLGQSEIPRFLLCQSNPEYYSRSELHFEADIAPLIAYSIITPRLQGASYDMHGLVQISVREWLEDRHELQDTLKRSVGLICDSVPNPAESSDTWDACKALVPHVVKVFSLFLDHKLGDIPEISPDRWAKLLYNLGYYSYLAGEYADALESLLAARTHQQMYLESDSDASLQTQALISRVFSKMGRDENARAIIDAMFEARRLRHGDAHYASKNTQMLRSELARLYLKDGNYDLARFIAQNTFEALEKMNESTSVVGVDALRTWGRALFHLDQTHHDRQAAELLERVFSQRQHIFGQDHIDTLISEAEYAEVLCTHDKYEMAIAHLEHAQKGLGERCGPDHPKTELVSQLLTKARSDSRNRFRASWERWRRRYLSRKFFRDRSEFFERYFIFPGMILWRICTGVFLGVCWYVAVLSMVSQDPRLQDLRPLTWTMLFVALLSNPVPASSWLRRTRTASIYLTALFALVLSPMAAKQRRERTKAAKAAKAIAKTTSREKTANEIA